MALQCTGRTCAVEVRVTQREQGLVHRASLILLDLGVESVLIRLIVDD